MDALNILALGLAAKGGGGGTPDWDDVTDKPFESIGNGLSVDSEGVLSASGGTTYTAGDNIDITNDEISVTEPVHYGIDLESLEEDGSGADYGVNGMMTANLSTNYDEQDVPIAVYAQSNAVDNSGMDIIDAELLGNTKMNEARYGVNGISIENFEIFDPTTSAGQSFNFSANRGSINYGWTSNDGTDETGSSITLTTEDDKLLVNGTPVALEGGGGSGGAVRYDEAQSLTDSQVTQAMSNLQLGVVRTYDHKYISGTLTSNISVNTNTQYAYANYDKLNSDNIPSSSSVKYILSVTYNDTEYTCEGYVSSGYWYADSGTSIALENIGNINQCWINLNSNQLALIFAANPLQTATLTDAKLYSKSESHQVISGIDAALLPKQVVIETLYDIRTTSGDKNVHLGSSTSWNTNTDMNNVVIGEPSYSSQVTNSILIGKTSLGTPTTPSGNTGYKLGNVILSGTSTSYAAGSYYYATLLGGQNNYVLAPYAVVTGQDNIAYSNNQYVIGKYNAAPLWEANHSYQVGDIVVNKTGGYNTFGTYKCKTAHTSSSLFQSAYWDWVGKSNSEDYAYRDYAFVIGNGTADNARSNALTVDWSGNLVCNNIPAPPTGDGTYNLQCTISSGVATYTWVAQS